jgi:cell division protein FtsQ
MKSKAIIKLSGLLLVLAFMVVSLIFIARKQKLIEIAELNVYFTEEYNFITKTEIEKIIKNNFGELSGSLMDTLNTFDIQQKIEEHPWVKKASVFKGFAPKDSLFFAGSIRVVINQEKPLFRIVNGEKGFYISTEGGQLPLSDLHTMNVPVVTGNVNGEIIQESILGFVRYISGNNFLSSLILQIHVLENGELLLVPRIGNHKIEFGKIENVEKKFRNLRAVYEQGFGPEEWEKYKTVKLKYKNQVICSLK